MIRNVQFLRFIAAAMVVFAHYPLVAVTELGANPSLLKLGGFGVDIFFVISGFIMLLILYPTSTSNTNTPSMSWTQFIKKRLYRVWPLYFVATVLVFIVASIINGSPISSDVEISRAYNSSKVDTSLALQSLTFSHAFIAPVLDVGWTLQFEFAFYITIASSLAIGIRKCDSLILAFASILLTSSLAVASMTKYGMTSDHATLRPLMIMANPMMIEFLIGMLLYRIIRNEILLGKKMSIVILLTTIPSFLASEMQDVFSGFGGAYHRSIIWGTFAFLLVWSAISLEKYISTPRALDILGNSSYSLYLVHWMLLPWISYIVTTSGIVNSINLIVLLALNLVICQAAAILTYKYVELPIGELLKPKKLSMNQVRHSQTQ
ncbi:acyltransferase family protein [Pseudomonas sp. L7]|uniref:acyltransferase family protein n=1 Tax=Pseudomonas sp. L7 TaxID=3388343 RepID=UPI0039854F68